MAASAVDMAAYRAAMRQVKAAERKLSTVWRKELRAVARDMAEDAAREGADPMPARGGLRARLMSNVGVVGVTAGPKSVTVRLSDRRTGIQLAALNRGRLRHPLWGNRRVWVMQGVPAYTWTDAFESKAAEASARLAPIVSNILRETATK